MISRTTKRFRRCLTRLPDSVRRQARKAYRLFARDPRHPSLRFKRIHVTGPIYSVRIGIDCRAVGVLAAEEMIWFWIGPHSDYEKLLAQL
jgi:hypothetical protein